MSLQPSDWNVIVIGRWNQAIFTPARIKREVFGLAEGDAVEVAVPLDGVSPYQIRHPKHNIIAMTDNNRLIIKLEKMDYESLKEAMSAGVKALRWLPHTPVSAAGFNVRYRTEEVPVELVNIVQHDTIDNLLSDLRNTISTRTITRGLNFHNGELNLSITQKGAVFELLCNFNRGSEKCEELIEWLEMPIAGIKSKVEELFGKLGLEITEATENDDRE